MNVRIATRGSDLARWQADHVAGLLRGPEVTVSVEVFTTRGDRDRERPLAEIGGEGLFTAEVNRALRDDDADIAVHSLKDLPIEMPQDLVIAAIPQRAPVEDVLISTGGVALAELRQGAVVGTSSPRREGYLRSLRPDLEITQIRGNVPTRLRRVAEGELDATLMARAGVHRLGLDDAVSEVLTDLLPAPGQGALAVAARRGTPAAERVAALDHAETRTAVEAERGVLAGLGGGCSLPLGTLARPRPGGGWKLSAVLYLDGGRVVLEETREGPDPARLAAETAVALRARGAPA